MAQDLQRWNNQQFACSIYQQIPDKNGVQFIVEAVHVDCPQERAYILYKSFEGMRGDILKYYIDGQLNIYESPEDANLEKLGDESTGFGAKIGHIQFKLQPDTFKRRMKKDKNFMDWVYETEKVYSGNETEEKRVVRYNPTIYGGTINIKEL